MPNSYAHKSILVRATSDDRGLLKAEKIEVTDDRRRVNFFHHAAARALQVAAFEFTGFFHKDGAMTRWIGAMPALPGFDDHGPGTSLRKNGWNVRKGFRRLGP
jgi:hypothetical protein